MALFKAESQLSAVWVFNPPPFLQRAFLSAMLLPPWVTHMPSVSCGLAENVLLRLQGPCPIPPGDACQGCPVLTWG